MYYSYSDLSFGTASFNFLKSASRTVNFERQELGQIMELDDVP